MIANEFQYNLTKSQAAQFAQALARWQPPADDENAASRLLRQAERDALQSQRDSLLSEIAEYEALRSGRRRTFQTDSFEQLPETLIRARIASGLTQKQLAQRLGWKERQIQKYEATGYASASLQRVSAVIRALGLQVREEVVLLSSP